MISRLARLLRKFMVFGGIGGSICVFGLIVQFMLLDAGTPSMAAFIVQLAITVALNVELNRRMTWRDRVHSPRAIVLSAGGRVIMAILSLPLFFILITRFHVPDLAANCITVGIAMAVNFITGEKLAFKRLHIPVPLPLETERTSE